MPLIDLGKVLLLIGGILFLLGLLLMLAGNVPFLGRLPGDISFQWGRVQVYIPLATTILLSLLLTVILNLIFGIFRR
ncbi:MAG: DUF2905 family protein [Chloroflexota bacterium]|jgi:hypothetical protein